MFVSSKNVSYIFRYVNFFVQYELVARKNTFAICICFFLFSDLAFTSSIICKILIAVLEKFETNLIFLNHFCSSLTSFLECFSEKVCIRLPLLEFEINCKRSSKIMSNYCKSNVDGVQPWWKTVPCSKTFIIFCA